MVTSGLSVFLTRDRGAAAPGAASGDDADEAGMGVGSAAVDEAPALGAEGAGARSLQEF